MSRSLLNLIVALALQFVAGSLGAQDTEKLISVLEAEIPPLIRAEHVPGLPMVLIRENHIVWKGVFRERVAGKT